MHFHHDGYHIGDPRIRTAARHEPDDLELVDEVDVLIVGTGPAGMILAAQLSQFAGIRPCAGLLRGVHGGVPDQDAP